MLAWVRRIGKSTTHTGTVASDRTAIVAVALIGSTHQIFTRVPNPAHMVAATTNSA